MLHSGAKFKFLLCVKARHEIFKAQSFLCVSDRSTKITWDTIMIKVVVLKYLQYLHKSKANTNRWQKSWRFQLAKMQHHQRCTPLMMLLD